MIDFRTHPDRYKHWTLSVDGPVATLAMDVTEDGGLKPGYELKLNSYDLGVDIELYDATQRLRFEHPEVGAVVHAHPVHATALACLHWDIPAFHYEVALAGGHDIRGAVAVDIHDVDVARPEPGLLADEPQREVRRRGAVGVVWG